MFGYLWLSAISFLCQGFNRLHRCKAQFILCRTMTHKLRKGRPLLSLVDLLAADLVLGLVQKVQHLLDNGLQGAAQVLPAVRLPNGRHVDKGGAPVAQVQRGVVGEVAQVPEEIGAVKHKKRQREAGTESGHCLLGVIRLEITT